MNLHTAGHAFSVIVVFLTPATTMLRAQKIEIGPEKIVDLTYDFDATTVYWPNAKSFDWQKEYWDMATGTPLGTILPASTVVPISMLRFTFLATAQPLTRFP
jgi:hypothetical protein